MLYKELLPHPKLRQFIHLYGILEDPEIHTTQQLEQSPPVINKGLMFHYRRDTRLIVDNGRFTSELPRGFILPQSSTPNVWKHHGEFGVFSVIFKPGMFRYLYPTPMMEFLNLPLTFEDFNDKSLLQLQEQIMLSRNHQHRVALCNAFFFQKVKNVECQTDSLQQAFRQMYQNPCRSLYQIIKDSYICERHFRRKFLRTFGISPKKLQQLIRMTYAINKINFESPAQKLTNIGLQCGFSDQSHFIRTFKSYTGLTPSAFRKKKKSMARYINHHDVVQNKEGTFT